MKERFVNALHKYILPIISEKYKKLVLGEIETDDFKDTFLIVSSAPRGTVDYDDVSSCIDGLPLLAVAKIGYTIFNFADNKLLDTQFEYLDELVEHSAKAYQDQERIHYLEYLSSYDMRCKIERVPTDDTTSEVMVWRRTPYTLDYYTDRFLTTSDLDRSDAKEKLGGKVRVQNDRLIFANQQAAEEAIREYELDALGQLFIIRKEQ